MQTWKVMDNGYEYADLFAADGEGSSHRDRGTCGTI